MEVNFRDEGGRTAQLEAKEEERREADGGAYMAISFKVSITLEGAHVGEIIQESPATESDEAEAEREARCCGLMR